MNYKKFLSWSLVVIWMVIIFAFSAQTADESVVISTGITDSIFKLLNNVLPNLKIETLHSLIRNMGHFIIYLILGFFVLNALSYHNKEKRFKFILALLICTLYAITDEIHQLYVPGRAGQISDVLIDIFGSIIGIEVLFRLKDI